MQSQFKSDSFLQNIQLMLILSHIFVNKLYLLIQNINYTSNRSFFFFFPNAVSLTAVELAVFS